MRIYALVLELTVSSHSLYHATTISYDPEIHSKHVEFRWIAFPSWVVNSTDTRRRLGSLVRYTSQKRNMSFRRECRIRDRRDNRQATKRARPRWIRNIERAETLCKACRPSPRFSSKKTRSPLDRATQPHLDSFARFSFLSSVSASPHRRRSLTMMCRRHRPSPSRLSLLRIHATLSSRFPTDSFRFVPFCWNRDGVSLVFCSHSHFQTEHT